MKSQIHDIGGGNLRIEVVPETYEEHMLMRAFWREHMDGYELSDTYSMFASKDNYDTITFGKPPPAEMVSQDSTAKASK